MNADSVINIAWWLSPWGFSRQNYMHFNNVRRKLLAHPQSMSFCINDLGCGLLLNHNLSMPGGGNGGWGQLCSGSPWEMWSIFHLILYDKNFPESGAPVCLLDLEVCQFVALAVEVRGGFCGSGSVRCRILLLGFRGELNVNYRGKLI